jgi:hypothetical protein
VVGSHLGFAKKNISGLASDKNRRQKEKFLPNTIIKNQSTLKIKQQERRPRKGRLGGDRAAFATLSRVPSKEK